MFSVFFLEEVEKEPRRRRRFLSSRLRSSTAFERTTIKRTHVQDHDGRARCVREQLVEAA